MRIQGPKVIGEFLTQATIRRKENGKVIKAAEIINNRKNNCACRRIR